MGVGKFIVNLIIALIVGGALYYFEVVGILISIIIAAVIFVVLLFVFKRSSSLTADEISARRYKADRTLAEGRRTGDQRKIKKANDTLNWLRKVKVKTVLYPVGRQV